MREVDYPRYSFGEFTLELGRGCLMRGPEELKLRPKSFKTFTYLVENRGRLVSKAELIGAVWPDVAVTDDSLVQCLIEIRKALADSQHYIKTVPRRGYIFTAELNRNGRDSISAESVEPLPVSIGVETRVVLNEKVAEMKAPSSGKRVLRKSWIIALASSVALVLAVLNIPAIRQRVLAKPVSSQIRSLAVLPLRNLSDDPAQDYLADGMTEALTTELARISSLTVISAQSTSQYRETRKTLREIASKLEVDGLVEGSVVRMGGSIRINVRMSQRSDGRYVWSDSYEGEIRDIFTLQRKVASAMTDEVKLARRELPASPPARTVDPEAYDAYQLGRFYLNKRTPKALRQSIEYFQQALQKDSNLAFAYAALADAYSLLGDSLTADMPPSEAVEKARGAALKALELDDTLAEAHAALGFVKYRYDGDWAGAEKEFRLAIHLNPGNATGYHWYALMLGDVGRSDEAETMIQRARSLDPWSPNIVRVIGEQLARKKQYDKAFAQLREAIAFDESHFNTHISLGTVFERMGQYKEAIAEYQKALELGGKRPAQAFLAHAHAAAGDTAEAEKMLRDLVGRNVAIAAVYTALGRRDEAFKYLELGYRNHSSGMTALLTNWRLEPLHSDPRFKDLLRRLGLPPDGHLERH